MDDWTQDDWAELDRLYIEFRETERVAIWGGSFEREHGARQHLRVLANKMFDKLLELLKSRSANNDGAPPHLNS